MSVEAQRQRAELAEQAEKDRAAYLKDQPPAEKRKAAPAKKAPAKSTAKK